MADIVGTGQCTICHGRHRLPVFISDMAIRVMDAGTNNDAAVTGLE